MGALEGLQYAYNWYESGDLSTEAAAEAFRLIVQDAPYNTRTCPNPAGGKIFRISSTGKVQEYGDPGVWQDPSGDATIPPIPAREGGTEADQKCLASKNAAHILELLYENITDSFNEGLDSTEAATALVLGIISLIGVEFAPITFALVTFFSIIFGVLYGILEFVGADLWDDTFTEALTCILLNCSTNVDGVVTFDWDCFQNALASQVTIVPLTFDQLRLFGQIEYLLLVIGGVDALNTAGATTAITDDDCSFCEEIVCSEETDFTDGELHDWTVLAGRGIPTSGTGLVALWNGSYEELEIYKGCEAGETILDVQIDYVMPNATSFSVYIFNSTLTTVLATLYSNPTFPGGTGTLHLSALSYTFNAGQLLLIDFTSGNNDGAHLTGLRLIYG